MILLVKKLLIGRKYSKIQSKKKEILVEKKRKIFMSDA